MLIRAEQPQDVTVIHELVALAFPTDAEARLVDLLRDADRLTVSLVAVLQNRIIGHIAFSPVTVEGANAALGLGLAPLAVAASERRRGVGAALVREGIAACRAAGAGYAVVLGEPDYYGRFGFRAASEFGLNDEYGGGPAFQALELDPGAIPRNAGLVRYAPEFGMFGGDDGALGA